MDPKRLVSPADLQGSQPCRSSIATARNIARETSLDIEHSPQPHQNRVLQHLIPAVNEAIIKMNRFYEEGNWDRATLYAGLAQGRLQYLAELMSRQTSEEP